MVARWLLVVAMAFLGGCYGVAFWLLGGCCGVAMVFAMVLLGVARCCDGVARWLL